MVKIAVALVVVLALVGGGIYTLLQPRPLPSPQFTANPEGVAQSTLNDVRIRDARWLAPNERSLWVLCRFGQSVRTRSFLLVDLETSGTRSLITGGNLVGWVNDEEVLVHLQGRTDSLWKQWTHVLQPESPVRLITRFFVINAFTGETRHICEANSTRNLNTLRVSPDGRRAVGCWGPKELYEFEIEQGSTPRKIAEPYVWAPVWVDDKSYLFVGETAVRQRDYGSEEFTQLSQPLLKEVRDAIGQFGAPTVKICGRQGENLLLHDHSPNQTYDRLLVLDAATSLVEEVARMTPSSELPRFNRDGGMMVYQGQQFDRNMDTVFLQVVEVDSEPVELITGSFGSVQESTPLFWGEDAVLYVHRGIELRSISLASGETELHWPIAVVPN